MSSSPKSQVWNAPNLVSFARLILSFVVFTLLAITDWWLTTAILFVVAVLTDALDGWLARKYDLVTTLGRILDPMVDKIIICGSFIFLQEIPGSGVLPWMTLIIIIRELYISSLRGFFEQQGIDFSAKWSGKIKMILQSIAIPVCLVSLMAPFGSQPALPIFRDVLLWLTVGITLYSGIEYTIRGMQMGREKQQDGGS